MTPTPDDFAARVMERAKLAGHRFPDDHESGMRRPIRDGIAEAVAFARLWERDVARLSFAEYLEAKAEIAQRDLDSRADDDADDAREVRLRVTLGREFAAEVRGRGPLPGVAGAVAGAVAAERERCLALVRSYLVFDNQRAVSWHEVQDCLGRIREGGAG